MGLFGHWSKKRDRQDEARMQDFNALLDRIEERIKEEQAEKPAETPEKEEAKE